MKSNKKYQQLQAILKDLERVVVAYSGGVDSTFLLAACLETLEPDNVLAVIGISASLARSQYRQAMEAAEAMGAHVVEVHADELEDANYAANRADRCFHCKIHLYTTLQRVGKKRGFTHVICGANFDDQDDFRPGNRAALDLGVHSPLMEAGLTKADIRELSRERCLPTADIPASPCLASRLSYGLEVTRERLAQVEAAEDFLRSLGFKEFRVRHHDTVARIEVIPDDLPILMQENNRTAIVDKLKSIGFKFVSVDLQGFRSGALNEAIADQIQKG